MCGLWAETRLRFPGYFFFAITFYSRFSYSCYGFPSPQIAYAAVDCTKGQNHDLCKQEGVEGYPTFNYYNYGKNVEKYNGERGVSTSI